MDKELISVIVPVYNVAQYLDACIESIHCQTYQNLEIILCDDCSTDISGKICDDWAMRDSRIRVLHKSHGGLSDTRNAGIEIANGEYLMFVDGDDIISLDTAQQLHTAAVQNDCQIAVCNMVRIFEDSRTEPFYQTTGKLRILSGMNRFETLNQPSVCNKLFRAELLHDLYFPCGKYYEDTFIYHILVYRAYAIALTGHDGYFYRFRQDSILGQNVYTDRYFDFIEGVNARMTYLLEHNISGYAEEACLSIYVAVAKAEHFIRKTEENIPKFKQIRQYYANAYSHLIRQPNTSVKQIIRLILLRYFPKLHSMIYGR